ncbi:MAG TPA: hypothetical protein VGL56_13715 [Fimbriimonadaceae bacterium]|jgi:hypothetical protein
MVGEWNSRWIGFANDPKLDLGVFAFRRNVDFEHVPQRLEARISADQRYKLYVNGQFVGFGPQRGDIEHWFYDTYDLAPYLKKGSNEIFAIVWNFGWVAPMAQISARTAFLLDDYEFENLSTPTEWQVAEIPGWNFEKMHGEIGPCYIDVGPGEIISGVVSNPLDAELDWREPFEISAATERGLLTGGTPWMLIPRSIPAMDYQKRAQEPEIRNGYVGDKGEITELSFPLELKAGQNLLLDYKELLCAYPRLTARAGRIGKESKVESRKSENTSPPDPLSSQGAGEGEPEKDDSVPLAVGQNSSPLLGGGVTGNPPPFDFRPSTFDSSPIPSLQLTYCESLWFKGGVKGNRDRTDGKEVLGYKDSFLPIGKPSTFEPLWWRTYRYLGIQANADITIENIEAIETGYPLKPESSFEADDAWVKPIWDVSIRTAQRCAGETYFDCPYYEQLQYAGDTRIQALIGYYLSPDRELQRAAVKAFHWSMMETGLTQSRYPTRQPQVIPPFSFWYLAMLSDQRLYDRVWNENEFQAELVDRGFEQLLSNPDKGYWNFGDWVPTWHMGVPPGGANSTMHSLTRFYADLLSYRSEREHDFNSEFSSIGNELEQARIDLEEGFPKLGGLVREKNEPPSEHIEALYRLCQIELGLEPDPWPFAALERDNAAKCTYYFSYYKHLAMRPNDYLEHLGPWKEMIEDGLTTFAENPDPVRSDCHAWSAHPILGFFQLVAGVQSTSAGWHNCRIEPRPGSLKHFHAKIAHPDGLLEVSFKDDKLTVDSPVPYELVWRGEADYFESGKNRL